MMDDSPQVLPLCTSSCSPFVHTRTVSYEIGRQIMNAVYSIFKKIRVPVILELSAPREPCWFTFGCVPVLSLFGAGSLLSHPGFMLPVVLMGCFIIYFVTLISVVYWYRDKPFRLVGAEMKFMVEVIPMIIAAAFHHFLEFHYGYLAITICGSTSFYIFAHFMHVSYDIGGIDVLFSLVMQVLVYALNVEMLARALALSFCFGLCFYRYMMYRAPQIPAHHKKELEQSPC